MHNNTNQQQYPVYEGDILDNLLNSKEWKNEELPI